ncbi:hypothetical protein FRC14_003383 [Serendipita sp. 396]|nr:hypothetical protein FRC14_003383 [Serendipita sp. 396]
MLGDQSAPIQLLKELARVSKYSSPAFTLAWLSELRSLLVKQALDREFVLEVLIELCASQASDPLPFFTQEVSAVHSADVLRHVITTMIIVLSPTVSRRNLARVKLQTLDELLGTLASWYEFSKGKGGHPLEGTDLLMKLDYGRSDTRDETDETSYHSSVGAEQSRLTLWDRGETRIDHDGISLSLCWRWVSDIREGDHLLERRGCQSVVWVFEDDEEDGNAVHYT